MDDEQTLEIWDRLVLLLIAQPAEGWEVEFREIVRREIQRLWVPKKKLVSYDE